MNTESISNKMGYRRSIFLSIILVSLGVAIKNTSSVESVGVVFIALGGFFLIVGMAKKRKDDEKSS